MSSLLDRCPACPAPGAVTCYALRARNARLCELIATGRSDYADLVARLSSSTDATLLPPVASSPDPADEVARRRAAKPRIPLGRPQKRP